MGNGALAIGPKLPRPSSTLPLRELSALTASPTNLRMVPLPLYMPDDYLRSIEPLIAIVLGCMRWKSAQAYEVRR